MDLYDKIFAKYPQLVQIATNKTPQLTHLTIKELTADNEEFDLNRKNFTLSKTRDYVAQFNQKNSNLMRQLTRVQKPVYDQILSNYPNENWQIDLFTLDKRFVVRNKQIKFFLVAVDVFSRYLWLVPMTGKSADKTLEALEALIDGYRKIPLKITSDGGSEFTNSKVKALFRERNIEHIVQEIETSIQENKHHVPLAERANKELRRWILQIEQTHGNKTNAILNNIQKFVTEKNTSFHYGINAIPAKLQNLDIWNPDDKRKIEAHLEKHKREPLERLPIGTIVRKENFQPGGQKFKKRTQRWSSTTHKITGYDGLKYVLDGNLDTVYFRRELLKI